MVQFHIGLFATLLATSCLQLILCATQMINGLVGCLCGTCRDKGVRRSSASAPQTTSRKILTLLVFFLFLLTATVSSLTSRWRTLLEEVCICLKYSVKSEMSKLFFKGLAQRKCINYLIKKINIIQQDQQRLWEAYCGIPFF